MVLLICLYRSRRLFSSTWLRRLFPSPIQKAVWYHNILPKPFHIVLHRLIVRRLRRIPVLGAPFFADHHHLESLPVVRQAQSLVTVFFLTPVVVVVVEWRLQSLCEEEDDLGGWWREGLGGVLKQE